MSEPRKRAKRGNHEGHIRKRPDGRWEARLQLTGWSKPKSFYGSSRKAVLVHIEAVRKNHADGMPLEAEKQTLGEFLGRWIEDSARPRLRPRTLALYRQIVRTHILPALGGILLKKLRPEHVQKLLADKLKFLKARTVLQIRAVLRSALNQAVKWQLVHWNVAALTDPPRATRHDIHVLDKDAAQRFLAVCADHRLGPLFTVSLALGLRLGEALGLQWEDVDLDRQFLSIRHALQRVDGRVQLVEPKSERSRRQMPLPGVAVKALTRHRATQNRERLLAGSRWAGTDFVFASTIGTPLDDSNVRKEFHRILEKAELPRMRIHDLRHSFATLLLALGEHPKVVQEMLGHSQVSLTLDTYSHLIPSLGLKERAVERLDALLGDCGQDCGQTGEKMVSRPGIEPGTRRLRVANGSANDRMF